MDYEKTLRAYTDIVNVMKSEQRSKASQLRNQGLGTNTPVDDITVAFWGLGSLTGTLF